ncbi:MAG: PfkB family carbohydrate kinase [Candidatus Aenigmatarchaeota archaeon]
MKYNVDRLLEIVDKFSGKKVGIIGDIMLDRFTYGDITRVSPEAPGIILKESGNLETPGGAGNVAKNIVNLDGIPYLIGIIGDDHEGWILRKVMKKNNIDDSYLITKKGGITTLKERFIDNRYKQQLFIRRDREDDKQNIDFEKFKNTLKDLVNKSDIIVISDYNKGVCKEDVCKYIIDLSNSIGKKVIVDPKNNLGKFRGAYLIKPNKNEIELNIGKYENNKEKIYNLIKELCINAMIVTKGEEGLSIFENGKCIDIPAIGDGQIVDITGAGDSVIAGLSLSLASNSSLEEAAYISNTIGGLVVRKPGTATVTRDELKEALKKYYKQC